MTNQYANLANTIEVDVTAPNGKIIRCIQRGAVLIAKGKVELYGMGKVTFPEQEEWEQLRKERAENQQKFSKNPAKISRVKQLKKMARNKRKSLDNLAAILKAGLSDSIEDRAKIVKHLLDVGDKIRVEDEGKLHRSKLDAPLGTLTIFSAWKVIDTGQNYLGTLKFIPPRQLIQEASHEF